MKGLPSQNEAGKKKYGDIFEPISSVSAQNRKTAGEEELEQRIGDLARSSDAHRFSMKEERVRSGRNEGSNREPGLPPPVLLGPPQNEIDLA